MAMTNDLSSIKDPSKIDIGKVFLCGKMYEVCKDGNQIYDLNSGNFHLLPELGSEDDTGPWDCFFRVTKSLREKIVVTLEKELKETHLLQFNDIKLLNSEEFERVSTYDKGNVYIGNGKGKGGKLFGIPQKYKDMGLNQFFRFIPVFLNGRYFTLNFMRFYLDKEGDINTVNCIYDEFQFDSTKDLSVNDHIGDRKVRYPSKCAESNELDGSGIIVCNPDVKNIWEVSCDGDKIKDVVNKFIGFICSVLSEKA